MTSVHRRWYVVQSQPNAELKAVAHLNRQGFDTYLPRYLKRIRHARRVDVVASAAVPALLLCFDRHDNPAVALGLLDCRRFEFAWHRQCAFARYGAGRGSVEAARRRRGVRQAGAPAGFPRRDKRFACLKASLPTALDFTMECRIAIASRSCSICSAARCACWWTWRPLRRLERRAGFNTVCFGLGQFTRTAVARLDAAIRMSETFQGT